MSTRIWWGIIIVLLIVIVILAYFLFATPAGPPGRSQVSTSTAATTTSTTSTYAPTRPTISAPVPNATVGQTFSVSGIAPNNWYFEAVFPVKVVDPQDNTIGHGQAQAQSDWTVEGPVAFVANVTIDEPSYHGPASLVLLKDNPSGLPQNDDSITVPIVIQ